ncbi:MAG: DUF488 domain-containing protein [Nitrospirae bacterium]|nr:DUF488 domain-containing protein [Nitrospirota bacterium]
MVIHTRSLGQARPGDLATYRWGSLRAFENGRVFAPSEGLLVAYKAGQVSWDGYERRYRLEMEALARRSPDLFLTLLRRPEVTVVCYEASPARCHRRLLADLLARIAGEQSVQVVLDVQ